MPRRVLILGTTGIDKAHVARQLNVEAARRSKRVDVLDFERGFLASKEQRIIRSFPSYLSQNANDQADARARAWVPFQQEVEKSTADVLLCCMHGVVVRHFYGVRFNVDVAAICRDIAPDLVITVLDDVYVKWWRTESRAGDDDYLGRPTLEQLIMARRCEAMVGDLIAASMSVAGKFVRHISIAVNHPADTLGRIVFDDAKVVYLSFPISAPRRMLSTGDDSLVRAVNEFHRRAYASQVGRHGVAFVSPLAIDELPLALASKDLSANDENLDFDVAKSRWPVSELWPNNAELLAASAPQTRPIPATQARNVEGAISTDVGWRDNRLVVQADALAVFSPVMPQPNGSTKLARGVEEEIERATTQEIRSFVFQDPALDPDGKWKDYLGDVGSMGIGPGQELIWSAPSIHALFEKLASI